MPLTEIYKEKLTELLEQFRNEALCENLPNVQGIILHMERLTDMLTEKTPFDSAVLTGQTTLSHVWHQFLFRLATLRTRNAPVEEIAFEEDHPFIQTFIRPGFFASQHQYIQWQYISIRLTHQPLNKVGPFMQFLLNQGFQEDDIIVHQFQYSHSPLYTGLNTKVHVLNGFAEYLLPHLEGKKGVLGFGGKTGKAELIHETIKSQRHRTPKNAKPTIQYFYDAGPALLDGHVHDYAMQLDYQGKSVIDINFIKAFLEIDAVRYGREVLAVINQYGAAPNELYMVYDLLHRHTSADYTDQLLELGEKHLHYLEQPPANQYTHDHMAGDKSMSLAYIDFLLSQNRELGIERIYLFLERADSIFPHFIKYLAETFQQESLPMLIKAIGKEPKGRYFRYHQTLFDLLDQLDYTPFLRTVLDYAIFKAGKEDRQIISKSLIKLGNVAIAKAKELLVGKTVNERILGALMLTHVNTPEIKSLLRDCVDSEINDDTRNIILETLRGEQQNIPLTFTETLTMIQKAESRKKLSKWNEKTLTEESLPDLYWTENGEKLKDTEIRFLFYRMKQAKGLTSEPEAREVLRYIDRSRSEKFASLLLQSFVDSNADAKIKHYLTLCGLLGDDSVLQKLNTLFRKSLADKRVKMAEYVLGAIAMIGSDKALRTIEVISRKYANKKPALSEAATASLNAAAEELNITQDQLADRIIPDFGFEDLYFNFNAGDESYRAFINNEFKLCFYNESHQLRKSVPTGTDKELVTTFKEIDKEIRDITRTQQGRLEKYLIEGRAWPVDEWQKLFFHNPIMFVYSTKLLWSLWDENENVINTFYCDEDSETFDVKDEAIDLSKGNKIRILHPTDLDTDQLTTWKEKLYHSNLKTIFPILERKVFVKKDGEAELNVSRHFFNEDVPKGADFVITHLTKCGWRKETGDGGRLQFTKHIAQPLLYADAYIEGPAAFYQGGTAKATVYEISFHRKQHQDQVKIKDVPFRFYSETMSDIDSLIKSN